MKQEHFSAFEKKTQLPITSFTTDDEPASVVFLFDVSGSVQPKVKALSAQSAYRFTQLSNESNDYMVIAFHGRAKVQCGWGCRGGELEKALTNIPRIVREGYTAFYDACDLAVDQLRTSKYRKQIIIIFSDGVDNASKGSFSKLRERVRDSSVAIYSIFLFEDGNDIYLGLEGEHALDNLAGISGGKAYYPRNRDELREVADEVAGELRKQYTISFNIAHLKHDNKWHEIKVKVAPPQDSRGKAPHVYLRYREGYYDR